MKHCQPNIVFILSDDQGAWAMGCAGNTEIITPHLDTLAAEGMRMDNFYCASPVCSPARASLLTGRIPSQHGVHDWLRTDTPQQEQIEYLQGMSSYTDVLAQNGYICGLSGKWHVGNSAVPQKGFTYWFTHQSGGGPYYNAPMFRDGKPYSEPDYITDVITEDALNFLENTAHGNTPFYLQVSYTAPHSPWLNNHPQKYVDMYQNCAFTSLPNLPQHPDSIYLTEEVNQNLRDNQIGYYAAVTAMDNGIGCIVAKLNELGLRENTLIIFTSDNGFSCGHHGFWGKGNGTFPINLYESSVKVPFIACHPGRIAAGQVCSTPLSAYDVRPTLLEYAGLADTPETPLPGTSFASQLNGKPLYAQSNIIVLDEYGPNRMIRNGDYKYIRRYPYGPDEMYNLAEDPTERNNLLPLQQNSEQAIQLRFQLENWFTQYANPAIDGAKEAVFGSGQLGWAGLGAKGKQAHSCDEYIQNCSGYKRYSNQQYKE